MTATQISIETAPRDLEGLKKVGRFNLRVLAQAAGLFETEAAKTAFMQATNDQQAETIYKLLTDRDGGGKAASKGAGGATGRAPSTKNAGKVAGSAGKVTGAAAAGSGGGGTESGAGVGAGAAAILSAIKELKDTVDGYEASLANLTSAVAQLQGISAGTNRFVALSIGLSGKLAEQTLGASLDQILEVVLDDMPAVEAAMRKMGPVAETEPDEVDETDEGNDE